MADISALGALEEIGFEVRRHILSSPTLAPRDPETCVKTLAVANGEVCFLVGLRLCDTLDFGKLAAVVGTGRRSLRTIDRRGVLQATGFPPGAIGPFSLREEVSVWLDEPIFRASKIFCGSGEFNVVLELSSIALLRLPRINVARLAREL
jgi:Cys-tRNA(Pro)/Cys-tRNA(Cys) deacylase